MKATYQQWIQYAASCGQGPEHETVKNWVCLARGIDGMYLDERSRGGQVGDLAADNTQQHKSSSGKRLWVSKKTALDDYGRTWGGNAVRKTKRLFLNLNEAGIDQGFWRSWLIVSRCWYTGGRRTGRYGGPRPTLGRGSGTATVHEDFSSKS